MKTLQERLKEARKAAQLTQAQLSIKSGLSQSTIAQIESGRNSGTRFADRLAKALDVPVAWLLAGQEKVAEAWPPQSVKQMSDQPQAVQSMRRAMDADEWMFLDLVEPRTYKDKQEVTWTVVEPEALRVHRSFFRTTRAKPENCKLLAAIGRSMEPFLFDGDWFIVDMSMEAFRDGINAFIREEGDYYVSQVKKLPDGSIRLTEFSSTEPPFSFPPGAAEQVLRPLGGVIFHTTPPTYQYKQTKLLD